MTTTFTALKRTHKILFISQVIVMVLMTLLIATRLQQPPFEHNDKNVQIILLFVSAALYITGKIIFQKHMRQAKAQQTVAAKLEFYSKGCIAQWRCLHLASVFSSACFFLVGNYSFIALAAFVAVFFFMLSPSKLKMAIQTLCPLDELKDLS